MSLLPVPGFGFLEPESKKFIDDNFQVSKSWCIILTKATNTVNGSLILPSKFSL